MDWPQRHLGRYHDNHRHRFTGPCHECTPQQPLKQRPHAMTNNTPKYLTFISPISNSLRNHGTHPSTKLVRNHLRAEMLDVLRVKLLSHSNVFLSTCFFYSFGLTTQRSRHLMNLFCFIDFTIQVTCI